MLYRTQTKIFIVPSYTALDRAKQTVHSNQVMIGAQNMHWEEEGQFTGEISPVMLREIGIDIIEIKRVKKAIENRKFVQRVFTQKEIDYYWQKLSVVPEAESCGWLKDKYGFSWQVVPERYYEMMDKGTEEQIERLSAAVLEMKKIDLDILEKAYSK